MNIDTNTNTNQVDEEKKVEAVRDFYENAVGDDVAVERLQAIGRPIQMIRIFIKLVCHM